MDGDSETTDTDGDKGIDAAPPPPSGEQFEQSLFPVPQQHPGVSTDVLVTIGDIACTQTQLLTPNGVFPLAGTNWIVTNNTTKREKIPTYAIVLAIVFALACLLGLLFLLIKERTIEGSVQVSVQSPEVYYATQIPISIPQQVVDIEQRVNYARGLVRALG
jgi:hypothetical protein